MKSKKAPYQLRWIVAGKVKAASFTTDALAQSRRSELWQAMRRGESFDTDTGLPESELRAAVEKGNTRPDPKWWDFCPEYLAARWRSTAAKTREGIADSLATTALAMMGDGANAPTLEEVRYAMRWRACGTYPQGRRAAAGPAGRVYVALAAFAAALIPDGPEGSAGRSVPAFLQVG
ncbi:hypothetical protein [Streptomyces sp. LN500]|uniref:hypothetical protein n=1 Tax=Streptomyces sp. LN500 TaxID=3112978 RepID=UPI00371C5A88